MSFFHRLVDPHWNQVYLEDREDLSITSFQLQLLILVIQCNFGMDLNCKFSFPLIFFENSLKISQRFWLEKYSGRKNAQECGFQKHSSKCVNKKNVLKIWENFQKNTGSGVLFSYKPYKAVRWISKFPNYIRKNIYCSKSILLQSFYCLV